MPVTMKNIAEAAGVSRAIVSAVLNERADELRVAIDTRQKVLTVAGKLGYCRNELARSVVTGRSRTIAFVTVGPMGLYAYTGRIQSGLLEAAGEQNYAIKLYRMGENPDELIRNLREWQVAGIIFHTTNAERVLPVLDALPDLPISLVNLSNPGAFDFGVTTDDEQGAYLATRHLIDNGCRKLICIATQTPEYALNRIAGFERAVAEKRLSDATVLQLKTNEELEEKLADLIASSQLPDGLFCITDTFAMQVERVALAAGIKIPQTLKLAGFGDLDMAEYAAIPLSTVRQDFEKMGFLAAKAVIDNIERRQRTPGRNECLKTSLVIRASSNS